MAATQIGADKLIFGTLDFAYGFFENLEFSETIEKTEATNADGDIVQVQFSGRKIEVTGTYTWRSNAGPAGTAALDTGVSITIAIAELSDTTPADTFPNGLTGASIFISEVKHTYAKGEFKKIDFTGEFYPSLITV